MEAKEKGLRKGLHCVEAVHEHSVDLVLKLSLC